MTPEWKAASLLVLYTPRPQPPPPRLLTLIPLFPRICFPVQVNRLPRETLLCATLYALPVPPPGGSSEANKQKRVPEALGWVTTPLFNFRQVLTCGRKLLGLWPATQENSGARWSAPNFHQPDSVILQVRPS